jgi:hypothetical protein
MRSWRERWQMLAAAVAFAEAGEWNTARKMVETADRRESVKVVTTTKRAQERPRKQSYRM